MWTASVSIALIFCLAIMAAPGVKYARKLPGGRADISAKMAPLRPKLIITPHFVPVRTPVAEASSAHTHA